MLSHASQRLYLIEQIQRLISSIKSNFCAHFNPIQHALKISVWIFHFILLVLNSIRFEHTSCLLIRLQLNYLFYHSRSVVCGLQSYGDDELEIHASEGNKLEQMFNVFSENVLETSPLLILPTANGSLVQPGPFRYGI